MNNIEFPLDEPLPRFSLDLAELPLIEGEQLTHQQWCNGFLARLVAYDVECHERNKATSLVHLARLQARISENSHPTLTILGGIICDVAGIERGKGKRLGVLDVSLTEVGTEAVLERYAQRLKGK
jgi:hypothetical protein